MPREQLSRLLARLAAAGVAEPSTLVIECAGAPTPGNLPRTAMSSRVPVPAIEGAEFHPIGLGDGYCTYALEWSPLADSACDYLDQFTDHEFLALGLREAVVRVRAQNVPVRRFVLTGYTEPGGSIDRGLAQAIADVLDTRLHLRPCQHVEQKGAEVLRLLEQDNSRYASVSQAVKALADVEGREQRVWRRLDRAREIAGLVGG